MSGKSWYRIEIEKTKNELNNLITPLEIQITELEEKIESLKLDNKEKQELVKKVYNMGFDSMEDYNKWSGLDKTSDEYLAIEEKRKKNVAVVNLANIENYEDKYCESYIILKKFAKLQKTKDGKSKKIPLAFKTLLKNFKNGTTSYDSTIEIITKVIEDSYDAHYQNLYDEACENGQSVYCPCGSILYLESGKSVFRCEKGTKHWIVKQNDLPSNFLSYDVDFFCEETPFHILE
jgi:hypothetical protein